MHNHNIDIVSDFISPYNMCYACIQLGVIRLAKMGTLYDLIIHSKEVINEL